MENPKLCFSTKRPGLFPFFPQNFGDNHRLTPIFGEKSGLLQNPSSSSKKKIKTSFSRRNNKGQSQTQFCFKHTYLYLTFRKLNEVHLAENSFLCYTALNSLLFFFLLRSGTSSRKSKQLVKTVQVYHKAYG